MTTPVPGRSEAPERPKTTAVRRRRSPGPTSRDDLVGEARQAPGVRVASPPVQPRPRTPPSARHDVAEPTELVRAIHAAPQQVVLELAGGTRALAWLHAVGGSSRTVLEATDRYSAASLAALLGHPPAKAVTGDVAVAMAAAARRRARDLAAPGTPVVGAACTAALASDRPRRGAHHAVVAVADALGTAVCELELAKGARTRRQEEAAASLLLLAELAAACGVAVPEPAAADAPGDVMQREFRPAQRFAALGSAADWLLLDAAGCVVEQGSGWDRVALLSGSYHPLHDGHLALAEAAAALLRRRVVFELTLVNADKAAIGLPEAQRRAAQFAGRAPLLLSREPLFAVKAALFPGAVFVVGVDTAARLVDPRFYGDSAAAMRRALAEVARHGCSFLVAGRLVDERYRTLADVALPLPRALRALFRELPEDSFRCDISSSEIRARGAPRAAG